MPNQQETPEEKRERLRQDELKNNPTGSLRDAFNRGSSGNLTDLTGGLGYIGGIVVIILLLVGYVVYKLLL